jgi:hypothetical protein
LVALPHFVWFGGSKQASPARAAVRMHPRSTQTAGEPLIRGRLRALEAALDAIREEVDGVDVVVQ